MVKTGCIFECAHMPMCLWGVDCEEHIKNGNRVKCFGSCGKCVFSNVCLIAKSGRKVGGKK